MQKTLNYIKSILHQVKLQFMCMDISCILVRIGWILFFIFGAYQLGFSQDSRSTFDRSVDFVNCEFAKQSIKEFNMDIYEKYVQQFPNCQGTNENFAPLLYKFLTENDMTGTARLASEINSFKKQYNQEFSPGDAVDEEDVFNVIEEKIFTLDKIKSFKEKHQNTFPNLRKNIVEQLKLTLVPELILDNNDVPAKTTQPEGVQPESIFVGNEQENDYYDEEEGDGYEVMEEDRNPSEYVTRDHEGSGIISRRDILWLFSLLMFGLLAFYFIRSVMPRYTVNQDYQSVQIDDDATKKLLEKLKKDIKDLKEEHYSLSEDFTQLNFRLQNIDRTVDNTKTAAEAIKETIEHSIEENAAIPDIFEVEDVPEVVLEEFFLPIPELDGSFQVEDALEEFKRTETVYHFKLLDNSPNQAEYKVVDDVATMLRALDDPDTYLKPACRSNAIIPISATKIITDESGIALLRGGEWKIIKKALIHYV